MYVSAMCVCVCKMYVCVSARCVCCTQSFSSCSKVFPLAPGSESSLAVSHAVVLPQDPRASTTIPAPGESADDWTIAFSGPADSGDFGKRRLSRHNPASRSLDVFPGGVGVDILDDIEMDHIHLDTQAGITLGADASTPKATGYLISTSPCGGLPLEFWGYQKPYSDCSMFKVRVLSGTAPVYWPHPSGSAALSSI